jgi:hypothetical protein
MILFGSAPGREQPGEPSAASKIARLRELAADPTAAGMEGRVDLTLETADAAGGGTVIPSIPSP